MFDFLLTFSFHLDFTHILKVRQIGPKFKRMHEHKDFFLKKLQLHLAYLGYLPCYLSPQPTYLVYLGLGIISDGMEGVGCELLQHLERFGIYLGLKIIFVYKFF